MTIVEDSSTTLQGTSTADSLSLVSSGTVSGSALNLTIDSFAQITGSAISLQPASGEVLSVTDNLSLTARNGGSINVGGVGSVNFGSLTFATTGGCHHQ
ncbi:MAG UNVERIFIED_CONTAM: hypothetical protein LVR18_46755 [Planctomycetaceae bacterium]